MWVPQGNYVNNEAKKRKRLNIIEHIRSIKTDNMNSHLPLHTRFSSSKSKSTIRIIHNVLSVQYTPS